MNQGLGKELLDSTPRPWLIRERIDKLEFIRMKTFCSAKGSEEDERQSTDWKETFINRVSDKELTLRLLRTQQTKTQLENGLTAETDILRKRIRRWQTSM